MTTAVREIKGVAWSRADGLVDYPYAVDAMEARAAAIRDGRAGELVWLVEHPPLYTAGTSATAAELLPCAEFPVFASGRGGRHTYHGPGQRVCYLMLDLDRRGRDVRRFVHAVESWVVAALGALGLAAHVVDGRVGIWVHEHDGREAKVGAIGLRVRRWVTLHGFSVNVAPDLSHFAGIVPCGLPDQPVTSLRALGLDASMDDLDIALEQNFVRFVAGLGAAQQRS